ncbi:hypothetical protein PAECIP111891_00266 [Paenibacillus allorhizoplanae]|uniref:Uncharacterized protein n=1 Tax=Paenibacillus allorhizoplanae TaxID=2905648 RepID=A0ABN8FXP3_9BACL|nr:hypothetical protein PAECIP111891_00266 [Paenibacillus allorhizoplanae]
MKKQEKHYDYLMGGWLSKREIEQRAQPEPHPLC